MSGWRPGQKDAILAAARARGMIEEQAPRTAPAAPPASERATDAATVPVKAARAVEPNKTEREYELMLRREFPAATIHWEAYTLRLASRVSYTPDWSVLHPCGRLDFFEVKGGYVFPRSLQKLRMCAEFFDHRFVLAQKLKSGWQITELAGAFQKTKTDTQP